MSKQFNKWLETFVAEKGIDMEEPVTVEGPSGDNHMTYGIIVNCIKTMRDHNKKNLKSYLVLVDFKNHDVKQALKDVAKIHFAI